MKWRVFGSSALVFGLITTMALLQRASAAPAVDETETAKKTFATLKERLPKVLDDFLKEQNKPDLGAGNSGLITFEIKSIRQIGSDEAKVTVVFSDVNPRVKQPKYVTQVLVIFLRYYDKRWTTTRFEHSGPGNFGPNSTDFALRLLMLAIDDCTEDQASRDK